MFKAGPIEAFRLQPRDIALIAMFAALTCVLAVPGGISFGGATPITLQTLGFMLAATLLGAPRGAIAVLVYVALIAIGLPVGAGGRGGVSVITGPSGGYLIGSIVGALVTGYLVDRFGRRNIAVLLGANVIGMMVIVYAIGIPWQSWRVGSGLFAVVSSSVQFLPGDLVKVVVTAFVTVAVVRAYPKIASA
ncbi:biotin transporter BioY [Tsukamurella sp. 8F]|uniref:biotin transporter BioY n=1 Tax=unclassified Tsukamurella TaxID=2633480 RepID=UPI0023B94CDA|nr:MULTISPECIES: biotin transporter BioY [unclassified Tsukamurella]MDF0531786.1 biotin transporter BioY [Tsukamurella sp. 8J]MDF0589028.1 biotin transporter BioY [Tsukamurella sp. 8F]